MSVLLACSLCAFVPRACGSWKRVSELMELKLTDDMWVLGPEHGSSLQ